MALNKVTKLDKIEIVNIDTIPMIQCRHVTYIEDTETGEKIGNEFHRHVVTPTDDVSGEPTEVQAMANILFTQGVKDAYTSLMQSQQEPIIEP